MTALLLAAVLAGWSPGIRDYMTQTCVRIVQRDHPKATPLQADIYCRCVVREVELRCSSDTTCDIPDDEGQRISDRCVEERKRRAP